MDHKPFLRVAEITPARWADFYNQVFKKGRPMVERPLFFALLQNPSLTNYTNIALLPEVEGNKKVRVYDTDWKQIQYPRERNGSLWRYPPGEEYCSVDNSAFTGAYCRVAIPMKPYTFGPFSMNIKNISGIVLLDNNGMQLYKSLFIGGPIDVKQQDTISFGYAEPVANRLPYTKAFRIFVR